MTILARTAAIQATARQWEDRAEELRGANRTLGDADAVLLGDRVARVARPFLDTWQREVDRLRRDAGEHAGALRDAASYLDRADADSRDRIGWLAP